MATVRPVFFSCENIRSSICIYFVSFSFLRKCSHPVESGVGSTRKERVRLKQKEKKTRKRENKVACCMNTQWRWGRTGSLVALTINGAQADIQQVSHKSMLQCHPNHIDEISFGICQWNLFLIYSHMRTEGFERGKIHFMMAQCSIANNFLL